MKTEKIRWEEGTVCWRDLGKREMAAKKRREEIGEKNKEKTTLWRGGRRKG